MWQRQEKEHQPILMGDTSRKKQGQTVADKGRQGGLRQSWQESAAARHRDNHQLQLATPHVQLTRPAHVSQITAASRGSARVATPASGFTATSPAATSISSALPRHPPARPWARFTGSHQAMCGWALFSLAFLFPRWRLFQKLLKIIQRLQIKYAAVWFPEACPPGTVAEQAARVVCSPQTKHNYPTPVHQKQTNTTAFIQYNTIHLQYSEFIYKYSILNTITNT